MEERVGCVSFDVSIIVDDIVINSLVILSYIFLFVQPTPLQELPHPLTVGRLISLQALPQTVFIVLPATAIIFLPMEYVIAYE